MRWLGAEAGAARACVAPGGGILAVREPGLGRSWGWRDLWA